ncbi:hypothetical protein ABPG74_020084 [Tetrahymena malaccensis]
MNKEFNCDIHTKYPIILVDILQESSKKLKCGKCISEQNQQMNFLFIPDIIDHKENSFFKAWPPMSDENLRKKIIELKNEHIDYNEKIVEFYDQFTEQIVRILSEKKKQQLKEAQKIYDFKDKIIEQYCKLADIEKLDECLNQENKKIVEIEQDLKKIIDSQFSKKKEYTSILQNMMKQFDLINQLNYENPNQLKKNIVQIVETINLFPYNNFNFSEEIDMFSIESVEICQKKLDQQLKINRNYSIIHKNLIQLLNIFQRQLKFINYPQDILNNCYFSNFINISNINNSQNSISAQLCPDKSVYQIILTNHVWCNSQCYIYRMLKPNKKYEIIIQFNKFQQSSQYFIGLMPQLDSNKKYLNQINLGFEIEHSDIYQQRNTLIFKVCIQDKLLQYSDFYEQSIFQFENANNYNNINTKGEYYFGIQFYNGCSGDVIDIISFNELEEFS